FSQAAMEEDEEGKGRLYGVEGAVAPSLSYPKREWMYRCACWRVRRSVAVSHWGRSGLIHRLSMGRRLVQDATKVRKQYRKVAGLHRCVRAGLIIGCIAMRSCCA